MYIYDILCNYTEYRRKNDIWLLKTKSVTKVDNKFIQNIIDARKYFISMGGKQDIERKPNRRFGMQVSSITCISFCGSIKKELVFNYNNAKSLL